MLNSTVDKVSTSFWPSKSYGHNLSAVVTLQGRLAGLAVGERREAYNLPLGHVADLIEDLFCHGAASQTETVLSVWVSISE